MEELPSGIEKRLDERRIGKHSEETSRVQGRTGITCLNLDNRQFQLPISDNVHGEIEIAGKNEKVIEHKYWDNTPQALKTWTRVTRLLLESGASPYTTCTHNHWYMVDEKGVVKHNHTVLDVISTIRGTNISCKAKNGGT